MKRRIFSSGAMTPLVGMLSELEGAAGAAPGAVPGAAAWVIRDISTGQPAIRDAFVSNAVCIPTLVKLIQVRAPAL